MKRVPLLKLFQPGAVVVIERVETTALYIGTVKKTDKKTCTLTLLGTRRPQRVALDAIRRAALLGDVDASVVSTIARHYVAAIAVRATDIGWVWG